MRLGRIHDRVLTALGAVESGTPADLALRNTFKNARDLGSKERAQVSEEVYGVIRGKMRLLDKLVIGVPAVVGGVPLAFKLAPAVIALMLPAVLIACPDLGLDPRAMTVIMAVATGISFALPVSTPAMAMAYGTGYIGTREGVGFGTVMSLLAIPVVVLGAVYLWPLIGLSPFIAAGVP